MYSTTHPYHQQQQQQADYQYAQANTQSSYYSPLQQSMSNTSLASVTHPTQSKESHLSGGYGTNISAAPAAYPTDMGPLYAAAHALGSGPQHSGASLNVIPVEQQSYATSQPISMPTGSAQYPNHVPAPQPAQQRGYGYNAVRYAADWLKSMGETDAYVVPHSYGESGDHRVFIQQGGAHQPAPQQSHQTYNQPSLEKQGMYTNTGLSPLAARLRLKEELSTGPGPAYAANQPTYAAPPGSHGSDPILPGFPIRECFHTDAPGARTLPTAAPPAPVPRHLPAAAASQPPSNVAVCTPPIEDAAPRRPQPQPPKLKPGVAPAAALRAMGHAMTSYEKAEVLGYEQVWFVGRPGIDKIRGSYLSADPNHGYDDVRGDYIAKVGDHILYRYEVQGVLGKGSFGQVLKCWDHATGRHTALKVIRNKKRFQRQAQVEANILTTLQQMDPSDGHNIVRQLDCFHFRSHFCITFEMLSINLYERIKAGGYQGAPAALTKRIAVQVLRTLCFLRQLDIIHCDIKPENILLKEEGGSLVKVIDFGSSCYADQQVYTYIQSRFYRAPEVILGLPYGPAIDMWSLGCVLAELHTGSPLFPGENEAEQLACIMDFLGLPPRGLLLRASRYKLFFDVRTGEPLPVPPNSRGITHRVSSKVLAESLGRSTDPVFLDFLRRCFVYEAGKRMTPEEALQHEWLEGPVLPQRYQSQRAGQVLAQQYR